MSSSSVGADKQHEDRTVKLPSSPDQGDPDTAALEQWEDGTVSWWDSDTWNEFCRLSFSSTDHGFVPPPVESRHSLKFNGCVEDATEETVPAKPQDNSQIPRNIYEETAGAPSESVDDLEQNTGSIIIYLDEELKAMYMQNQNQSPRSGAMDMTPLENLRRRIFQDDREPEVGYQEVLDEYLDQREENSVINSPLHKLIDDLTAVRKLLTARRQVNREEVKSTGVDSNSSSRIDMELIWLMQQLALHNDRFTHETDLPRVLRDPVITDLWVRERLRDKWQEKCTSARTANNEIITSDEPARKPSQREKRHRTRKVFDECAEEVLTEVKQGLNQSLMKPVQELEELKLLHDVHRHLLHQDEYNIVDLIAATEKQQTNLTRIIGCESPLIDDQAQALSGLMGMAHRTTCALETRIKRLSAKDVRDHEERRKVRESRLGRPEAMGYLSKAWQDLQLLRDQTRTVIAGLQCVESELDGLRAGVADLYDSQRACLLAVTEKCVR